MITSAVINQLLSSTELRAFVGKRIYPNVIKPKSDLPAVYVYADRMEKEGCYDPGSSKQGALEIGIAAETYDQASKAMNQIRLTLDDFSGIIGGVGLVIMRGEETADQYDDEKSVHIKVIEYQALAQIKS